MFHWLLQVNIKVKKELVSYFFLLALRPHAIHGLIYGKIDLTKCNNGEPLLGEQRSFTAV